MAHLQTRDPRPNLFRNPLARMDYCRFTRTHPQPIMTVRASFQFSGPGHYATTFNLLSVVPPVVANKRCAPRAYAPPLRHYAKTAPYTHTHTHAGARTRRICASWRSGVVAYIYILEKIDIFTETAHYKTGPSHYSAGKSVVAAVKSLKSFEKGDF